MLTGGRGRCPLVLTVRDEEPDPIVEVLDRMPGSSERAELGGEQAAAGQHGSTRRL